MNLENENRSYWLKNTVLTFGLQIYKYMVPSEFSKNGFFSPAGLHHLLSMLFERMDKEKDRILLLKLLNIPAGRHSAQVLKMKWSGYRENVMCSDCAYAMQAIISTLNLENPNIVSFKNLASSTVHFAQPFLKNAQWSIEQNNFFLTNDTPVMVDFLVTNQILNYCESDELDAHIVQLNYQLSGYHLIIILPNDITKLEEIFTHPEKGSTLLKNGFRDMKRSLMILRLPRLVMNGVTDLTPFLKKACSEIEGFWTDTENVQLSFNGIRQYILLKTVEPMNGKALKPRKNNSLVVNVNRPFFFMVLDQGLPVLMGRVSDPSD